MKKARVILLNPPTAAVSTEVLLNLAYLAVSLREAGHEVKILDATAPYKPLDAREIKRAIAEFAPHFIGVTLTIVYIAQTYLYLKDLRKMNIPIVAGGPHANCLPGEVLENGVDIAAIGEGEEAVVDLAEYFVGNKSLKSIAGLCFKDGNGKFLYTAPRKLIENLDTIPFPDFRDFPIRNYTGSDDVNSNPIFWSLFTSRGCPFDCIFCSSHNVFGRVARFRSARNVFEEIKSLSEQFGVKKVAFQDDEILSSKKRFLEFCDLICNSELKLKMSIRTRIDSIDREILLKAKSAGITRISFGIESWADDTLLKINKKYTVKTIREKFRLIEETKFPYISFNNICGFPWETKEYFRKHLREIRKIPKSVSYFTYVTVPIPYPKTRLYEMYHQQFNFTNWWLDLKKHPPKSVYTNKSFLKHFAWVICPLYIQDSLWGYSKKKEKEINWISWKIFDSFIRRHYKFHTFILIIFLCRVSYLLLKISPQLEQFVFSPLLNSKFLSRWKEKISFITKY